MPFQKGASGNLKGRCKEKAQKQKQIKELLLKYVPDAVDRLAEMLDDPDHKAFAVKEILDRVYGKSPQSIELGEESTQALTAVLKIIAKEKSGG